MAAMEKQPLADTDFDDHMDINFLQKILDTAQAAATTPIAPPRSSSTAIDQFKEQWFQALDSVGPRPAVDPLPPRPLGKPPPYPAPTPYAAPSAAAGQVPPPRASLSLRPPSYSVILDSIVVEKAPGEVVPDLMRGAPAGSGAMTQAFVGDQRGQVRLDARGTGDALGRGYDGSRTWTSVDYGRSEDVSWNGARRGEQQTPRLSVDGVGRGHDRSDPHANIGRGRDGAPRTSLDLSMREDARIFSKALSLTSSSASRDGARRGEQPISRHELDGGRRGHGRSDPRGDVGRGHDAPRTSLDSGRREEGYQDGGRRPYAVDRQHNPIPSHPSVDGRSHGLHHDGSGRFPPGRHNYHPDGSGVPRARSQPARDRHYHHRPPGSDEPRDRGGTMAPHHDRRQGGDGGHQHPAIRDGRVRKAPHPGDDLTRPRREMIHGAHPSARDRNGHTTAPHQRYHHATAAPPAPPASRLPSSPPYDPLPPASRPPSSSANDLDPRRPSHPSPTHTPARDRTDSNQSDYSSTRNRADSRISGSSESSDPATRALLALSHPERTHSVGKAARTASVSTSSGGTTTASSPLHRTPSVGHHPERWFPVAAARASPPPRR
ncbi:hypothetical protein BDK51DRAFT_38692 [Blyttiomyces helicus]|uniref:Uncharacterized protein n=1 Tax=Blyttiomyces helicus TaxID=388810 RepID=A0A4P9WCU9_9FUNG|nr:hypothetical protein BDK51DRAFT_38692 [Blyttiomyces helicus]|eukprot:RKO89443.1 hypothetical protein BDK51DRAFT_38692 [Blyttiomyces helicus]